MSQQKYGQIINCGLTILIVIGVRGGERGGLPPPGLKNFRAAMFYVFHCEDKLLKNLECKMFVYYSEKFQSNSVFQGKRKVAQKSQ